MTKCSNTDPLRRGTLREWRAVVRREAVTLSWRDKARLAWTLIKAALEIGGVSDCERRLRMKSCLRCPVYDPVLRRCGPYDGAPTGCKCFVPYLSLIRQPYSKPGCWAKQQDGPISNHGWI
jgi:hypothetical protein